MTLIDEVQEQVAQTGGAGAGKGSSRWRPGCLLVPLAVVLVLVLLDMAAAVFGRRALDRQIQLLASQGHRISSAGMLRACSDSDNAAPIWERALASYKRSGHAADAMDLRATRNWSSLTAEDRQAMREHFSANAPVIALMKEAASRPCFTFAPDYSRPMSAWEPPRMTGMARLVKELTLHRGHLAHDDGNTSEAIDCVVLGAETARSFARLPTFVSVMLARLILARAVELAELVLPNTPVPDDLARRIIDATDPAIYRDALADGLDAERVMLLEMTTYSLASNRSPLSWGKPAPPFAALADGVLSLVTKPIVASDGALIQDAMVRASNLARKEPWEAGSERNELDSIVIGLARWRFFARAAMPRIAGMHKRGEDTLTRGQIMRVALACKRYRNARGLLPDNTELLAPDFLKKAPLDPNTGKPMPYVRLASDNFAIYSVGSDGKDDTKPQLESGALQTSAPVALPRRNDDLVWVESGVR